MVNGSPAPLFTRPPTPPKENVEDSTKISIDQTYQGTLGQQVLLDTPDESPASSSEYFNGSGGKLPKRVVFSPWTSYHKPLVPMNKTTTPDGKLRPLLPSKQCVASHKSILKVSTNNSSPSFDMPQQLVLDPNETVAVMLRSVTQHLSSASRDSRLDSYKTLLGCLSAYEEVPDTQSLIQSLTAFLEYIRRDIAAKQATSGGPDVELASHALKVLKAILYTPGLTAAVPHEFGTFIAEQAVSSMESQDTPKVMLDHYMQLLAQQKLPQKIINSEKANRILNALNGLETRIKGNRVIGLKLMIYQRLLVQATSLMVPRAVDWLEFLIVSMSSSIKDIRSRAIAFGIDAALTLGTTSTVSQSCIDILDRETPAGPKVVDCLGTRMVELLNVKNEGLHVPQMWIVTVLFLRSRRRQIERWQHMQGWLGIMQRAFNSSDPKVKLQANIAWNRLVAATNLDTSTSTKFIRMLRQPIASQLERKTNDNQMRHAKQIARSTYCNLLYYAFHPGATFEHLDLYWDGYVAPVLSIRPSMEKSDVEFACRVLGALFSSTQPRIWNHNRAHQLTPMKPEELPCLDPKWTRSRAAKVISVLENLPLHITLAQPGDVLATPYFETWRSFVKALGDAASKEIKVSMETMTAMAHIMTMLYRYWSQSYNSSKEIPPRLDVFVALINETVAKVGFRPFTEKRLFHARPESSFEAAETPSSHSGRPQRILKSPITFLLDALVNATPVHEPAATYRAAVKSLLDVALRTASGRRTYLVVLWELAQDIILGCPGENSNRVIFWEYLVKETARAIAMPPLKTQDNDNHGHPGNDYREALRLLELGIREFGYETYTEWKTLSNAVIGSIQDDGGHAGILLVYTEPLSKIISEEEPHNTSDNFLRCGTYILENIRWPESRQALERVRKQLWGPGFTPRGPPALDPFNHLYLMVEGLLTWTYPRLRSLSLDVVTQFMASVNSLLLSCPASLRVVCLKRIQRGLGVWIEDKDAVVPRSDGIQKSNDLKAVVSLCSLCSLLLLIT